MWRECGDGKVRERDGGRERGKEEGSKRRRKGGKREEEGPIREFPTPPLPVSFHPTSRLIPPLPGSFASGLSNVFKGDTAGPDAGHGLTPPSICPGARGSSF